MTSLNNIKAIITQKKFLLAGTVLLIILIVLFNVLGGKGRVSKTYLEPQSQPVIDGKLDENSKVNKESKTSIEKLANKLPYRETITTTTGTEVRFAIIPDAKSPYTLYVEIFGIDFVNDYSDPQLPKNVEDFRNTSKEILSWINKQGANPSQIFISWGDEFYVREAAKAWLEPSSKYPNVVKKGDEFVFEQEPTD